MGLSMSETWSDPRPVQIQTRPQAPLNFPEKETRSVPGQCRDRGATDGHGPEGG
jgi:hypothetical protein